MLSFTSFSVSYTHLEALKEVLEGDAALDGGEMGHGAQVHAQLMQVVENMEECILSLIHTDQLLYIIQQQHIDILIEIQEVISRILTDLSLIHI